MTTKELIFLADRELDSRHLAQPQIRKKAVRKVVDFMETTGSFLNGDALNLPSDKKILEHAFTQYNHQTVYGLNGAINVIYQVADNTIGKTVNHSSSHKTLPASAAITSTPVYVEVKEAEEALIGGTFVSVNSLTKSTVPDVPGLYCIKLRKGAVLPAKYGKIREDGIIYIGLASTSLHQRFWKQELNHIGAATFFRGIGAILGYLPPKGSLYGKTSKNYKFNDEDTEAIRKWIRLSLLVNWIRMDASLLGKIEETLIKKYQPLMNTSHNPNPSKELAAARKRCRDYAQSK